MVAIYNGEIVEFDFEPGERICLGYRPDCTGTVKGIVNGLFVEVEWDQHCKDSLGLLWTPMKLVKLSKVYETAAYGNDCPNGKCDM